MKIVEFPQEWVTADPVDRSFYAFDDLRGAFVLLSDKTTLLVLIYPGGHRFARVTPLTDWALQEAFGPDPLPADSERVALAWRALLCVLPELKECRYG